MNRRALVTGAGSGIGRAIAVELAEQGFDLLLVGRDAGKLAATSRACGGSSTVDHRTCDLSDVESLAGLCEGLGRGPVVDVFVSSAGTIILDDFEHAQLRDLETMMNTNFRAPLLLVRSLLPTFADGGSMVFINSMAGLRTSQFNVMFSTTKHALTAMANGLRPNVAPRDIRVLSVYPPLTATPTGEYVKSFYGSAYRPELLLQPETIATAVTKWILDTSDDQTEMLFPQNDGRPA
jgi:short-subunit dehydrogenase